MSTTIASNPAASRYEARIDGELGGYVTYVLGEGVIDLQHTVVLPTHRGQGIAGMLAERAFEDARAQGLKVLPTCSFVLGWTKEHPEVADLLAHAD